MAAKKIWSLLAFLVFLAIAIAFPAIFGSRSALAEGQVIPVRAMRLPEFKRGEGPVFGKLEYLGGLVLATKNGEMGAVSSIRLTDGGSKFISVMDTGHWATGTIRRDADGTLAGIEDYRIWSMEGPGGQVLPSKDGFDAESMVLGKDRVYVGFEREHRIDSYPNPGFETSGRIDTQKPVLKKGETLKYNGGMEAILKATENSPLAGSLFFVAEFSYNKDGNFIAGVQSGPRKGPFYVERIGTYAITDGVVLDDRHFLLLERKFGLANGIGMRIRKFAIDDIKPGATLRGEVLMEADFSHQIDNMEGLDAYKAADGSTHLVVVSDDNHSLLERNLMLEFKMLP